MAEDMTFLPKAEILTLEELDRLCGASSARGVKKLRLTGASRWCARNIMFLFRALARHLESGALQELRSRPMAASWRKLRARSARLRCQGASRFRRYAGSAEIHRHHALGQARQGAGRPAAAKDAGLESKITPSRSKA